MRTLPEVAAELIAAADWYDEQQCGLGERFLEAYQRATDSIAQAPQSFARLEALSELDALREIRRCMIPRFSYAIVFEVIAEPVVLALIHTSRRPEYWARRIAERRP